MYTQNFYKEIEKHELYVRYIYKLSELHEKNHSYTEAGFTLLLHARELEVQVCVCVCVASTLTSPLI